MKMRRVKRSELPRKVKSICYQIIDEAIDAIQSREAVCISADDRRELIEIQKRIHPQGTARGYNVNTVSEGLNLFVWVDEKRCS
jgi:hypothetical protein